MRDLLKIGRSLNSVELKGITAGRNPFISDGSDQCQVGQCPNGLVCNIVNGECIMPGGGGGGGGGGICPENVGQNCDSPV
ncbi:hypothetical protein [uncultured Dokdonia sp.]|uniref:hypothetical protein n=1 Tax=uncultured Dokdonia sp. TaxID=575653 RepID=UPI0026166489|nr:hypothetical protein [uncultured Dokdonia sp.]